MNEQDAVRTIGRILESLKLASESVKKLAIRVRVLENIKGVASIGGNARKTTRVITTGDADLTVTDQDHTIRGNATTGHLELALPPAADVYINGAGQIYAFKKTDASANEVRINGDGSETIDGSSPYALTTQYESVIIQSNGATWDVLAS